MLIVENRYGKSGTTIAVQRNQARHEYGRH